MGKGNPWTDPGAHLFLAFPDSFEHIVGRGTVDTAERRRHKLTERTSLIPTPEEDDTRRRQESTQIYDTNRLPAPHASLRASGTTTGEFVRLESPWIVTRDAAAGKECSEATLIRTEAVASTGAPCHLTGESAIV